MKPFNLERAKAGDPVVTRDGRKARYLGSYNGTIYKHIFIISAADGTEICMSYTNTGVYMEGPSDNYEDLFMAPIKKEGWINIYSRNAVIQHADIFKTREDALAHQLDGVDATIKIEWME